MRNNDRICMVVEMKHLFYSFAKELNNFVGTSYVVLLKLGAEAHASQFPENDISLFQEVWDECKIHDRSPTEAMAHIIIIFHLPLLSYARQKDSVNGLTFWYRDFFDEVLYI